MLPLISLDATHVDLWLLADDAPRLDDALPALLEALLPHERARIDRIVAPRARREQILTRVLLRRLLSRYAHVDPSAWRFDVNAHGRPFISAPPLDAPLTFNLSHTAGMIACIIGRARLLGVDVETDERQRRILDIADRFFSPLEARALHELPAKHHVERFLAIWTLKEAYIKARGMGLAIPLHHFTFHLDEGALDRISFDPALDDEPTRWHFLRMRPTAHHHLAIALRVSEGETQPKLHQRDALPLLVTS